MNDLNIQWETGRMIIHMDYFFPCPVSKQNKLLKIIDLDYLHKNDLILQMKQYLETRLDEIPEIKKNISKDYFNFKQTVADISAELESGKHANGVPLTKQSVAILKKELSDAKQKVRKCETSAKNLIKTKEKYEKLLENLKKKG